MKLNIILSITVITSCTLHHLSPIPPPEEHWPDLHKAAYAKNTQAIENLVKQHKPINQKKYFGYSPLHIACEMGAQKVANILITHRANVNQKSCKGSTALHYAAKRGNINLVKTLIKHGADINAKNNKGYSALDYAASRGHTELVELLLLTYHAENTYNGFDNPLITVAYNNALAIATMLLEHHSRVNQADRLGRSPLFWAVLQNLLKEDHNQPLILLLLSYKANINQSDRDCISPLMLAKIYDNQEMITLLTQNAIPAA